MSDRVRISKEDISLILDELESNRPYEACGVLVGTNEGDIFAVKRAVPVENCRRTERSFELEPMQFYRVWDSAEKEGLDVIGVYHTHPSSLARPSDWDRRSMENSPAIWVIAGVDGIFAYRLVDGTIETVEIV